MLSLLELRHFKCFELLKLPLGSLTVLSGTNASGKSSVLQSLVLLHQTMRDHEWSDRLTLNGDVTQVGTVSDVVDQVSGSSSFEIGLSNDASHCRWTFVGGRRDMSAGLAQIAIDNETIPIPTSLRWLLPADVVGTSLSIAQGIRNLTYITAERDGPREVYPIMDEFGVQVVGSRGEYAVSALFHRRDSRIADELILPGMAPTLARQVEARLDTFFPGCRLDVQQVPNVNAATLRIRVSEETDFLRPIHCGFGITQILPIVVAVLSARAQDSLAGLMSPHSSVSDGDPTARAEDRRLAQTLSSHASDNPLILIENPEVHLHPAGQAQMGEFLADATQSGIQIIVETHSDHVLNGIRRSVKSGRVSADDVAIHFFRDRFRHEAQVLSPSLYPSGNIDVWPEGFFDQIDKDLNYFAGWGE